MFNSSDSMRIPEQVIYAQTTTGPNGYAESNYVAELLLDYAAQKLPITTSIARIGQVAGAVHHTGSWDMTGWFPSLIRSSLHVGTLPYSLGATFGRIDWLPVDVLTGVLVEIALSDLKDTDYEGHLVHNSNAEMARNRSRVYHPLHPHPVMWKAVRGVVAEELSSFSVHPIEINFLYSWLANVRQAAHPMSDSAQSWAEEDLEASLLVNPAVKWLDFFEEMLRSQDQKANILEMVKTLEASPKLRSLPKFKIEWMQKWIRELMESS
ncbi:hypothetical protein JMJ35_010713 [Cladonia borealis]|uniref:Thioester reductase (TE) domain-containing protein n=1 Tax=Cladonia borealis TaxID=184061 RepID=A0AA39QR16_9LECA|nr:hypothetical protein JMJ35_010713 [Cladonia borealis]